VFVPLISYFCIVSKPTRDICRNTSMLITISFSAYFRSIYCGYWPSQICFIFVTLLTISTNTPPKSIDCWKQCKSKNLANLSKNTPANVTGWFSFSSVGLLFYDYLYFNHCFVTSQCRSYWCIIV
jgi:hypothetical protein